MTTWIMQSGRCECQIDQEEQLPDVKFAQPDSLRGIGLNGRVLNQRYQLLSPVGRGGLCLVYRAKDLTTNQTVAIKLMRAELSSHEPAVQRLIKEVNTASQLNHPHLVRVHGYGHDRQGEHYLVMDFVEGENLEEVLSESGGKLQPKRALKIFTQISEGLRCAHQRGIIHRDIKPSNIIIGADEEAGEFATIVDFGFAKAADSSDTMKLTQTGEVFGSPFYMSPEHCLGKALDQRSDIYSLGCLMYETLCGKPPFVGENVLATVAKQATEEPESMRKLNPLLSENLDNLVLTCLAKEPLLRYQTVNDLLLDLHKVKNGKKVNAPVKLSKQPSYARELKSTAIKQLPGSIESMRPYAVVIGALIVGIICLAFWPVDKNRPLAPANLESSRSDTPPEPNPKKNLDSGLPSRSQEMKNSAPARTLPDHGTKSNILSRSTREQETKNKVLSRTINKPPASKDPIKHPTTENRTDSSSTKRTPNQNEDARLSKGWNELKELRLHR